MKIKSFMNTFWYSQLLYCFVRMFLKNQDGRTMEVQKQPFNLEMKLHMDILEIIAMYNVSLKINHLLFKY